MHILSSALDIICTIAEAFYMYNYAEALFEHRIYIPLLERHKWLFFGIPIFLTTLIVFILNSIVLTSPYTVVVLLVQSIFTIWALWRCDFLNAVAVAGGYLLALSASGTLEISITGFIGGDELIRQTTAEQGGIRAIYLCLFGVYWFAVNISFANWLKKRKIKATGTKYLAVISIIGLLGFLFIADQMLLSFNIFITTIDYFFLFAVSICIFATYYKVKNDQLRQRLEMIDAQNEMLEKKYQQVSDMYMMNARLYHDMDHHFRALYHMADGEESIKSYIESLNYVPTAGMIKSRTSIDTLDVILSEMEKRAEDKGISINLAAQILPQDIGIEKKDMCALFANLLENSIEAALKEVNVVVKYVNKMLIVRIENDYQVEPVIRDGHLQTTKKDKLHHGWGTQSIEFVVDKYDGDIEYKVAQDKFCVDIVMSC